MVRDQKVVAVLFVDKNDRSNVIELGDSELVCTEKAIIIDNVCFPLAFQKGVQLCDQQMFTELQEYL